MPAAESCKARGRDQHREQRSEGVGDDAPLATHDLLRRVVALPGGRTPVEVFTLRSTGHGAHGLREYAWALVQLPGDSDDGFDEALLIRRGLADGERAYYLTHAPAGTPPAEIVRAAGARWAIEECFQAAKNEAGLDHYQVRRYPAWYRHITLAMSAAAYLAAIRVTAHEKGEPAET